MPWLSTLCAFPSKPRSDSTHSPWPVLAATSAQPRQAEQHLHKVARKHLFFLPVTEAPPVVLYSRARSSATRLSRIIKYSLVLFNPAGLLAEKETRGSAHAADCQGFHPNSLKLLAAVQWYHLRSIFIQIPDEPDAGL